MPTYPLELPTYPNFATSSFGLSRVVAGTTSSFTDQQQIQAHSGRKWMATFTLPTMEQRDAAAWKAFFMSLNGMVGTFKVGDPDQIAPFGKALGAPQVLGAGQSGNVLNTNGWTPSVDGQLLPGDYIQLVDDLYMVGAAGPVDSDATGFAAIEIEPALRNTPADGLPLVLLNTTCIMRLSSNLAQWSAGPEGHMTAYTFACREAI